MYRESLKKNNAYKNWSLRNWLTFLMERAPPVVFLLLAAGPSLSGLFMCQGFIDIEKFIWTVIGELVLLLLIRIMDDVKDYDIDKVVHPERPLPRGLIRVEEVKQVIYISMVSMFVYAAILGIRFNWTVAGLFALQVFYTFLMFIEFGCGSTLEKSPIIYGLTHQVSIYFGAYFICALGGKAWDSSLPLLMGSVAFSGFFTYEICRKLDPTLAAKKGTYLVIYGKRVTFCFTLIMVSIGVVSSYAAGLHWLLWPLEAIMILSLVLLFLFSRDPKPLKPGEKKPKLHKPVEALSIIYILLHMWSGYIARFF